MDTILSDTEIQTMEEAAENGSGDACYRLGEHYYALSEKEEALEWYKKAVECEAYNPCVYFNIGYAYQHGEGTAVDMTEACKWYQRGAQARVPQALYNLAYFYQNGLVVHRDYDKAAYYATAAANEMSRQMTRFYEVQERYKRLDELDRQILDLEEALRQLEDENAKLRERAEAAEQDALAWRNTAEAEGKKRLEEKMAYEEKIRKQEAYEEKLRRQVKQAADEEKLRRQEEQAADEEKLRRQEEQAADEEKLRHQEEQAADTDTEEEAESVPITSWQDADTGTAEKNTDIPKMKFCIQCGRAQKASNKFCIYCGRTW